MHSGAPIASQPRRHAIEQALKLAALSVGQAVEQRSQRPRTRHEDGVGYLRARLREHKGRGAAIRPGLAADKATVHESVDHAHGGGLGPSYDASQLADRATRPRSHVHERARLGLAEASIPTNCCTQPIQHAERRHAQELVQPIHNVCMPDLMHAAYVEF